VYEARAAGADCILLIIAILDPAQYADLFTLSVSMGMDVLVEIFDEPELEAAMQVDPRIVGINNRNLKTLETSLSVFETIAPKIPADRIRVAESGMSDAADIERMGHAGANAVLVGESLMKAGDDISKLVRSMAAVEVG
jgi:indole-3-glycerol phosphate synthase